ncbi:disulfide bond formation protein B [Bacillus thuringiensis]|uniref:Disulfide bond formation protein B n=4 Tax=Bacillus TaxID=1386 RepID=A0A9X7BJM9_BACTU|nr:disulfide bond formation protein B [Bacillus cereus]PFV26274.1 disulfide bond formation protein B [Bacillus thuringiensis]SFM28440.1 disulfide bond formation protein DsbB [Bacillus sp. 5mfcol3.1]
MIIMKLIRYNNYMFFVTMVSFIGTVGSLFLSEIMNLVPCSLCWYQRICLYPIFIICIVSLIKRHSNANEYIKYFSGIGLVISLYQYIIQMTQTKSAFCHLYEDCSAIDFVFLKFITIPFLAMLAFLLLFSISFLVKNQK